MSKYDIDLYRAKSADAAEADLRQAAARDIGDWFRFEIGPRQTVGESSKAVRFAVVAYIGQQQWERFRIDLVGSDMRMTDASTLDEALAIVRPFVNPLLQGTAGGRWDHERCDWTESEQRAD